MTTLLEIKNLSVNIATDQGDVHAVRDVSLSLEPGETLAIVGESGDSAGKGRGSRRRNLF